MRETRTLSAIANEVKIQMEKYQELKLDVTELKEGDIVINPVGYVYFITKIAQTLFTRRRYKEVIYQNGYKRRIYFNEPPFGKRDVLRLK